jgi:hypothetical protein
VCLQANATATTGPVCPLTRHKLAVPTQDGVRCHDGRDLRKQAATEAVSQFSEPPTLAVFETQALPREAALQNSILLAKERNQVGLLTMEPGAQCRDQQLQREHA